MGRLRADVIAVLLLSLVVATACMSTPPAEEPPAVVEVEVPGDVGSTQAAEESAEADAPESAAEPVAEHLDVVIDQSEIEYAVSEEIFTETFANVRTLIDELNKIIQAENYGKWLTYLADDYAAHFSSQQVLREASEQPLLRKYNIRLRSLKDYFTYVVAPSRSNARLDDLVFVDKDRVKAIMVINEQRTILYLLTRVDGVWKIGL